MLGQENDRHQVQYKQNGFRQNAPRRGVRRGDANRIGHCEEFAMAAGLNGQERNEQPHGDQYQKPLLAVGERGAWRGLREIGQHQAEYRQRYDHAEIGVGALQIVLLLSMPPAADQQTQAYHAVQEDHHHGEQRIARQRGAVVATHHDRGDAHYLDQGDGQRQDQCAVGFAQPLSQMIRMADNGKCGAHYGAE